MKNNRKQRPRAGQKGYDRRPLRDEDKFNREREGTGAARGENDISWYTRYPNLLQAAGSFPYPYRPGMTINLGSIEVSSTKSIQRQFTIPGVLALDWIPSVGNSSVATDPASILGKEFYAKVRQAFSGSLDADAPDYVMYVLALDSIFAYIAWLKRLYRLLTVWTPENYALPDVVLRSMGLREQDIANLRSERTRLWQYINELVLQSRKFSCPASIDYINRHYWMSDNVYSDADQINSQFYLFNPKALFKFVMLNMPDGNPGPGVQMTAMPWVQHEGTSTYTNVSELYQYGKDMIEALVAWDDAYTINGYLRRAFEGEQQFIVDELPAEQPFNPVYSEEVLAQIENSRPIPRGSQLNFKTQANINGFNVTQNVLTNAVLSGPTYTVSGTAGEQETADADTLPPILNIRSVTPTVADNVLASRLQAVVLSKVTTDTSVTYNVDCASELPISWSITTATNGNDGISRESLPVVANWDLSAAVSDTTGMFNMLMTEAFDWHPLLYVTMAKLSQSNTTTRLAILGDVANITYITNDDMRNLHRICLYSEFNSFSIV